MPSIEDKRKPFTIVELIAVIGAVAVLYGVIALNMPEYLKKSKIAKTKADIGQIAKAMEIHRSNKGCLPAGMVDDPDECLFNGGGYKDQEAWNNVVNELIITDIIPENSSLFFDPWGNPYNYDKNDQDGNCSPIWSFGPNGVDDSGWDSSNSDCPKKLFGDDIGISLSVLQ